MRGQILIAATLLVAAPLFAQPDDRGEYRPYRSEIQLQLYRFDNFFQARGDAPEESVSAGGAEYRAAYRRRPDAPDIYGALYVLNYGHSGTETSFGGRVGVARYGSVHWFNVYVDRLENGWSFDIDETRANANVTTLAGSYSYRLARDWRIGLDSYNEWQRFDVTTGHENDYQRVEFDVRYRGLRPRLEPSIGYAVGRRNVQDDRDSYDDRQWFVQLSSDPHPRLDLSLRYRNRTRDYRNVTRTDDRNQWQLRAIYRQNSRLRWMAMFTTEDIDSSLQGRDYDTGRLFAGITYGF